MDTALVLDLADQVLAGSTRTRFRSLLHDLSAAPFPLQVCGRAFIAGEALCCAGDSIELKPLAFAPGKGFHHADTVPDKVVVTMPELLTRSIPVCPGAQLICCGTLLSSPKLHVYNFAHSASVHFRPELDCTFGWDCTHLFCGGLCGWSQAVEWLPNAGFGFALGRQVLVDHDETILQLCKVRHKCELLRCPIRPNAPWNPAGKIAIVGDVADPTIPFVHRCQVNLMCTLSPPCQSWSKGGKSLGLMDPNGWSFVAGLEQVFMLQPILACAECVDELASHVHFKLVQCIATLFGYRMIWSQIVPYHELAHHCRTRWLCVWVRADVTAESLGFSLPCSIVPRVPWNDDRYHFRLPKVWTEQARLSSSEAAIYNDPQLVPAAKRAKIVASTSPDAGLQGRLACPTEPLPTLCASYSSQHHLASDHLQTKGIFAVLKQQDGFYCFLDPAHFCSLFGTLAELVLPSKLSLAFKVVGNAITIPHSVMCICVGLYAVLPESIDPVSIMRDAWEHRLTAQSAVLFEQGPFVRLMPAAQVHQCLTPKVISQGQGEWRVQFLLDAGATILETRAPSTATFIEVLTAVFDGPEGLFQQSSLLSSGSTGSTGMNLRELAAIADDWDLLIGRICLLRCRVILQPVVQSLNVCVATDPCPATVPIIDLVNDAIELPCPGTLEMFGASEVFVKLLEIMKRIDFVKGSEYIPVYVVHHMLPGAVRLGCNHANYDEVLAGLQRLLSSNERLITTFAQDRVADGSSPSRIIHIFEQLAPSEGVAVIVCLPEEQQVMHSIVGSAMKPLPTFQFKGALLEVAWINEAPSDQFVGPLQHGALLSLQRSHEIRAGGHHLSSGATPTLAAGADFQARAEYMCNTHGWIAADELWSITQNIMFMQDSYKFTAPVYWNQQDSDFTLSPFGELYLFNNTTNVICVLVDDHWAATEIRRTADAANLNFVQLPRHLQNAATRVVARLLDIAPHRLSTSSEHEEHLPHLCGWRLVQRWIHLFDLAEDFQPETFAGVADRFHDIITMTMECALEDWRTYNAPPPLAHLAALLRKKFLIFLAQRESQQNPIPQKALVAAWPVRLPPLSSTLPTPPPSAEQVAASRIATRLEHMLTYSGWMASDEMDFSLDVARIIQPSTLFCAPAVEFDYTCIGISQWADPGVWHVQPCDLDGYPQQPLASIRVLPPRV